LDYIIFTKKGNNMIETSELNKLSIEDRMILLEKIWSSLKQESDALESPAWHEDILSERRRKIKSGEADIVPIEKLRRNWF
jgi:putative addiction module component (TIGR02574 family)